MTTKNNGESEEKIMYIGRDMTELSMMAKKDWKESELAFFHHSLRRWLLT
jgi:hypothetical protein